MADKTQPRALVALSEDRQWLVVRFELGFETFRLVNEAGKPFGFFAERWTNDTGQDAHEVLAAWLEGRGG